MAPLLSRSARLLSLALAGLLVACGSQRPSARGGSDAQNLQVVTTFLPITLFTRAVAGDCAEVTALIPPNSGPHDFQARPADLAALQQARVLVKNGLGMEGFLEKLLASASNPQLAVVDTSRGVSTLPSSPEPAPEQPKRAQHDHGKREASPHGGDREHGYTQHNSQTRDNGQPQVDGKSQDSDKAQDSDMAQDNNKAQDSSQTQEHAQSHDHGAVNPHIWLDPLRAVQQVEAIRDGLVKADPSCAENYRRNAATTISQLRQLDQEIAAQLKPYRGKTFVAFHDVAPYFAERYGLKVTFLVDIPELNPSPVDLQRVTAEVKRSQLKALLSEPQQGNRSLNALAGDLGVKVSVFDPLETASEQASRDPATYVQVMRRNVTNLRQAFGE